MWVSTLWFVAMLIHDSHSLYERVTEQVSVELSGFHICYSLLNGTHQTGCQSDQDGNIGIILYYEDIRLIQHFDEICVDDGSCNNFIVVIKFDHLNEKSVELLRKSPVVKGMIVIERYASRGKPLSEDAASPNEQWSAYLDDPQWNAKHAIHPHGLRFLNWNKPIFHVSNESDVKILLNSCYKKFNEDALTVRRIQPPYCYAKLTSFMLSAGDAETCTRRETLFGGFSQSSTHLCDPVQDENVIGLVPPMEINETGRADVFLLSSRMDGFSSFTTDSGGDVSILTSLIATLAVGEAIGQKMEKFGKAARENRRHLMFGFFNGESLGYIGSSRAVWDIQNTAFPASFKKEFRRNVRPINLTDISIIMELQQIYARNDRTYFIHTDWDSYTAKKDLVDSVVSTVRNSSGMVKVEYRNPSPDSRVPPASCHAFLKANSTIPCVVVSSFDSEFNYNAINSMSDRIEPRDRKELALQVTAIASSALYASLGFVYNVDNVEDLKTEYKINSSYVDKLVECFVFAENWHTCELFKELLENSRDYSTGEKRVYTGTGSGYINIVKTLVGMLLVQAIGTTKPTKNVTSADQCNSLNLQQNVYRYVWMFDGSRNASFCYQSSTYLTTARSPAFDIEGYDWSSLQYSTWVESVWQPPKLTLFLVSDDWPAAVCLAVIVLIASAVLVWRVSEDWFESGPVRNDAAL